MDAPVTRPRTWRDGTCAVCGRQTDPMGWGALVDHREQEALRFGLCDAEGCFWLLVAAADVWMSVDRKRSLRLGPARHLRDAVAS